jgi:TetR/AcrR family transcriptional regulator, regulator of biofilm formation and stress response
VTTTQATATGHLAESLARGRRYDPDRRQRLIETTLDVIAEHGVTGTSHRRIAAAADVPLGSMTYHFSSMHELLLLAFAHLAQTSGDAFDAAMAAIEPGSDARSAVVGALTAELAGGSRSAVLTYELYALAARDPAFRVVTQAWMDRTCASLERHFDTETARVIDALIEGLVIHATLSTEPIDRTAIRAAVARVT